MNTKKLFGFIILATLGLLVATACSLTPAPPEPPPVMAKEANMDGHGMEHVHLDPPHEYADLTNPFYGDGEAIAAGKIIFETNCVACHGPEGKGNGPAAAALNPKPANLANAEMMGEMSDGYAFWRVSEGGVGDPFNSAMPAWKELLTEEQRWQVLSYAFTLSGVERKEGGGHSHGDGDEHGQDEHMDDGHDGDGDEHGQDEHMADG
ncbi:MAG: c-type cytochrome, partial [Anaerolineae bacterium]